MVSVQFLRSRFSSIKKIKGDLILKFKENFHGNRFNKKYIIFKKTPIKQLCFLKKNYYIFLVLQIRISCFFACDWENELDPDINWTSSCCQTQGPVAVTQCIVKTMKGVHFLSSVT